MQRFADESNPVNVICKKVKSMVNTIHVSIAHGQPIIGGSGCETYLDAGVRLLLSDDCAGFDPQLIYSDLGRVQFPS